MNFDTEVLNERLKETRDECSFYATAIEMMIKKYKVHKQIEQDGLENELKDLTEEVKFNIIHGEVPTMEDLITNPISVLDDFVQDFCYVIGSISGMLQLKRQLDETGDEDTEEYMAFLSMTQTNQEFVIQACGFSALTLMTGRVPSGTMLERMFPISDDKEINQTSIDLVVELNGDTVMKYMQHREKYFTKETNESV